VHDVFVCLALLLRVVSSFKGVVPFHVDRFWSLICMTKEREKSDAAAQSLSLEHAKGMVSWARGDVHPIPGAHKGDAAAGGNESVLGWAEKRCICLEIPKPCAYLLIKKQ
jgi:hypothetical protein